MFVQFSEERTWYIARNAFPTCRKFIWLLGSMSPRKSWMAKRAARKLASKRNTTMLRRPFELPKTLYYARVRVVQSCGNLCTYE